MRYIAFVLLSLPLALVGGCGGNAFGNAQIENVVDTIMLGALVGTPISVASAFSVAESAPVRTDLTSQFDFAYNILPDQRRVLLPRAALGLRSGTADPGLQRSEDGFDQIDKAPLNGYFTLDTIPIAVGERYVVRSRIVCTNIGVPVYGKIEILSFDDADRRVTFRVLANRNCGFRSLQPGVPED
ncbi:MAG TPA: hypothetical protein VFU46_10835 [Gemmatimonadales bacterium]|nr:hypothetical protein [Gemmatimonadales bacterium]